jgi:hypothetical protein
MTDISKLDEKFLDFLRNTYEPIERLDTTGIITTQSIIDMGEMHGFLFPVWTTNDYLLACEFNKIDIPNRPEKVWLVRERIEV